MIPNINFSALPAVFPFTLIKYLLGSQKTIIPLYISVYIKTTPFLILLVVLGIFQRGEHPGKEIFIDTIHMGKTGFTQPGNLVSQESIFVLNSTLTYNYLLFSQLVKNFEKHFYLNTTLKSNYPHFTSNWRGILGKPPIL
ncbi:MAG: hypothetical protein HN975_16660 [Anaerolineae bacterium]|nr:hypothetical protein [Anaerolineae bacterium]